MRTIKEIITEAVASRNVGKYTIDQNSTIYDFTNWLDSKGIDIVDKKLDTKSRILSGFGKGVCYRWDIYDDGTNMQYIVYPKDRKIAFIFTYKNDELLRAYVLTKIGNNYDTPKRYLDDTVTVFKELEKSYQ